MSKPAARTSLVIWVYDALEKVSLPPAQSARWFFARAEFALAKRFRASAYPNDFIDEAGNERPDWLRNWILSEA